MNGGESVRSRRCPELSPARTGAHLAEELASGQPGGNSRGPIARVRTGSAPGTTRSARCPRRRLGCTRSRGPFPPRPRRERAALLSAVLARDKAPSRALRFLYFSPVFEICDIRVARVLGSIDGPVVFVYRAARVEACPHVVASALCLSVVLQRLTQIGLTVAVDAATAEILRHVERPEHWLCRRSCRRRHPRRRVVSAASEVPNDSQHHGREQDEQWNASHGVRSYPDSSTALVADGRLPGPAAERSGG